VIILRVRRPTWAAFLAMVLLTVTVPACSNGTTIVDCIVGAHHPAGREDTCVADSVPQAIRARLLAIARTAAQENNGAVKKAVAVDTDRSSAVHYTGGNLVGRDGFVWFVEIAGNFRCGTACAGPSTTIRSGTALTLDVDVTTYVVTDLGLRRAWIDPSHLGEVVTLGSSALM
jgi:hypothetical protein